MAVDRGEEAPVTFKDKLSGWDRNSKGEEDYEDDDFDLKEGVVLTAMVDGIPNIKFSGRVHTFIQRSMSKSIIVKLIGRKIGFIVLTNKIYGLWRNILRRFRRVHG